MADRTMFVAPVGMRRRIYSLPRVALTPAQSDALGL
jgi:hypothetical protein